MEKIVINKEERVVWLDALKGFGIIMIMLVHTGMMPSWSVLISAGYISLFFIASGFTFKQKENLEGEIKKRGKRLLTPYFFWGIIAVLITITLSYLQGKDPNIGGKVIGLLYSRHSLAYHIDSVHDVPMLASASISPMWFLTALFTAYVLLLLLLRIENKQLQYVSVVLFIIISMALIFFPVLLPWSIDTAFVGALLIFWGMHKKHISVDMKRFVLCAIIYVGLVYFEKSINVSVRLYGGHGALSVITYILIGILETDLLITLLWKFEWTRVVKCLSWIGKFSLVLMCIHAPIYTILSACGLQSTSLLLGALFVLIATAIGYIIYMVGNKYINKNLRYIFGL